MAIINLKVIPGKLFYLADLPETRVFGIYELAELVMIGKDKYFKFLVF